MAQDPRALLQQADKAASSAGSGFSFFGGRGEKWEQASELYTQAANVFRIQKQGTLSFTSGKEAGIALEKAAEIQRSHLNEPDDAANTLTEAFKVYKKTDPEDAARVLRQVIQHHTTKGNFRRAATQNDFLAEIYENEIGDPKKAMEAYLTSGEWYESDNAEALANKAYLKFADLAAEEGDYSRAVETYERVAKSSIQNNLMKWSVKEYLLKAGICHLASNDMVATNRALQAYCELDNGFAAQREYQLLVDLAQAVEKGDQEMFADSLFKYDQMSKLDRWKTKILLKVKESIEQQGDDFS